MAKGKIIGIISLKGRQRKSEIFWVALNTFGNQRKSEIFWSPFRQRGE